MSEAEKKLEDYEMMFGEPSEKYGIPVYLGGYFVGYRSAGDPHYMEYKAIKSQVKAEKSERVQRGVEHRGKAKRARLAAS